MERADLTETHVIVIFCCPDSASKHALQGYFDSVRVELGPRGIRVSIISPGYIKTALSSNALSADGSQHGVTDASTARGMEPADVAHRVMTAVATNKKELIIAKAHHHLAVYLKIFFPSILDWALRKRSKVN